MRPSTHFQDNPSSRADIDLKQLWLLFTDCPNTVSYSLGFDSAWEKKKKPVAHLPGRWDLPAPAAPATLSSGARQEETLSAHIWSCFKGLVTSGQETAQKI